MRTFDVSRVCERLDNGIARSIGTKFYELRSNTSVYLPVERAHASVFRATDPYRLAIVIKGLLVPSEDDRFVTPPLSIENGEIREPLSLEELAGLRERSMDNSKPCGLFDYAFVDHVVYAR